MWSVTWGPTKARPRNLIILTDRCNFSFQTFEGTLKLSTTIIQYRKQLYTNLIKWKKPSLSLDHGCIPSIQKMHLSLFYERGLSLFFAKLLDNELLKLHYFLKVAKRETGSLHIHMFEVKPAYGPKALFFIKFFNIETVSKSCNCTKLSWLRRPTCLGPICHFILKKLNQDYFL